MKQLNVALVGLGFGGAFAAIYKEHPLVGELTLCDPNADRLKQILQYVSCCFLAHEHRQIAECHFPGLAFLLSPLAYALSVRRKRQFCRYIYG